MADSLNGDKLKNTLMKIGAAAAGITLVLCLAAVLTIWYVSRPQPPKEWDDKALTSSGLPGFGSYPDTEYHFYLAYSARNTTSKDWTVESANNLRLVTHFSDGSLSNPIEGKYVVIRTPIFIPAKTVGTITLHFMSGNVPKQLVGEPDEVFHERIRKYLNINYPSLKGFILFDDTNRIQVDLPRWGEAKPENAGEVRSDGKNL